MKIIMTTLWILCKWICGFILWIFLMTGISQTVSHLQKEYYMPNDQPADKFMVAAQVKNKDYYQIKIWQDFINSNDLPFTQADEACIEDCLRQLENGHYVYFFETAGYASFSEYQIQNNQVTPISFKEFHLFHLIIGMLGAFFIFGLYSYFRKWLKIRKDKTELSRFHRTLFKKIAIYILIVAIGWTLIYLNAK